jgi:hypothetical protein
VVKGKEVVVTYADQKRGMFKHFYGCEMALFHTYHRVALSEHDSHFVIFAYSQFSISGLFQ